jgi:hypothetical protein
VNRNASEAKAYLEKVTSGKVPLSDAMLINPDHGHENGFEMLRFRHSRPHLKEIPVIVRTTARDTQLQTCRYFGVRHIVSKDDDPNVLREALSSIIEDLDRAPASPGDPRDGRSLAKRDIIVAIGLERAVLAFPVANAFNALASPGSSSDHGTARFRKKERPLTLSLRNTRTTGTVPRDETGAMTWTTFHSLPRRLTVLPTVGVSILPVGSSSISCKLSFSLY